MLFVEKSLSSTANLPVYCIGYVFRNISKVFVQVWKWLNLFWWCTVSSKSCVIWLWKIFKDFFSRPLYCRNFHACFLTFDVFPMTSQIFLPQVYYIITYIKYRGWIKISEQVGVMSHYYKALYYKLFQFNSNKADTFPNRYDHIFNYTWKVSLWLDMFLKVKWFDIWTWHGDLVK